MQRVDGAVRASFAAETVILELPPSTCVFGDDTRVIASFLERDLRDFDAFMITNGPKYWSMWLWTIGVAQVESAESEN
eukprot:g14058.t1